MTQALFHPLYDDIVSACLLGRGGLDRQIRNGCGIAHIGRTPILRALPNGITFLIDPGSIDSGIAKRMNSDLAMLRKRKGSYVLGTTLGEETYRTGVFVGKNGIAGPQTVWQSVSERRAALRQRAEAEIALQRTLNHHPSLLQSIESTIKRNLEKFVADCREPDDTDAILALNIPGDLPGEYIHFKGGRYIVEGEIPNVTAATEIPMVIYHVKDDVEKRFVRDKAQFFGLVLHPTGTGALPRFRKA